MIPGAGGGSLTACKSCIRVQLRSAEPRATHTKTGSSHAMRRWARTHRPRRTVKFASCRYLLIVVMIQLRWGAAWRSGSKIVLSELFFISCVNPFYFPSVGPEHGRI